MKTFKDIDEFVVEAFPLEYNKIMKQRETSIEESIETIDNNFINHVEGGNKNGKSITRNPGYDQIGNAPYLSSFFLISVL
jgi:hypothetical protein